MWDILYSLDCPTVLQPKFVWCNANSLIVLIRMASSIKLRFPCRFFFILLIYLSILNLMKRFIFYWNLSNPNVLKMPGRKSINRMLSWNSNPLVLTFLCVFLINLFTDHQTPPPYFLYFQMAFLRNGSKVSEPNPYQSKKNDFLKVSLWS